MRGWNSALKCKRTLDTSCAESIELQAFCKWSTGARFPCTKLGVPHAGFPSAVWLQMCHCPAQAGVGMGGELCGGLLWCVCLGTVPQCSGAAGGYVWAEVSSVGLPGDCR